MFRSLITLLTVGLLLGSGSDAQRVAVVGGGVAGASASYFLTQHVQSRRSSAERFEIEVFEREALGGRAQHIEYDGVTVELGASIIWVNNYLVAELADVAGLQQEFVGSEGLLAIYDGRTLVFQESRWRLLTLLRMILRYWLSWFTFKPAPASMFTKFEGIYRLLDNGTALDRPEQLLQAVGLYDLTQASMFEWLRERYGQGMDLLAKELIAGVNKVNYGQSNAQLNALAGHVSMLPATEPRVFRIRGGNSQLAAGILQAANATVHHPVAVLRIDKQADGRYRLRTQQQCSAVQLDQDSPQSDAEQGPYDAVIIATPLESSGLSFSGVQLPTVPARKYQQTVTTIVKGAVRPSYFGLTDMIYGAVMVSEDAPLPWNSLSVVGRTKSDNVTLWKLFSPELMTRTWLEMMFEGGFQVVATKAWSTPGAYPRFDPPEDFAPFKLDDGLFYTAALENSASAMEVAAIEGRMAALLTAKHLAKQQAQQPSQQAEGMQVLGTRKEAAKRQAAATAA